MFELIFTPGWASGTDFIFTGRRDSFLSSKKVGTLPRYQSVIDPFTLTVWIATLVSIMAFWASLFSCSRAGFYDNTDLFNQLRVALCVMLSEDIPNRLLSFQQQSKQSHGLKILLVTLVPMALLLSMAYQSNLLASLVRRNTEKPIDTYQDVLDRGLKLYVFRRAMSPFLLRTSPFPLERRVFQVAAVQKGGLYDLNGRRETPKHIYSDTLEGKALIVFSDINFHQREHVLRRGRHLTFASFPKGFFCAMNHPVLEAAAREGGPFQRLVESGTFQRMRDRFVWVETRVGREYHRNKAGDAGGSSPLTTEHLVPILLVTGVITVVSMLIFACEKAISVTQAEHQHH